MPKPTAPQLNAMYMAMFRSLGGLKDRLMVASKQELIQALNVFGGMDCLYDFGALHGVQFILPLMKQQQEEMEDNVELFFTQKLPPRIGEAEGWRRADNHIRKGYNASLDLLKQQPEFAGVAFPPPQVLTKPPESRQKRRRKGKGKRPK